MVDSKASPMLRVWLVDCGISQAAVRFSLQANTAIMRNVVEEHYKICGNERGRDFLSSLWKDHSGRASFLHSPLLMELAAVELASPMTSSVCAETPESQRPSDEEKVHHS